MWFFAGMVELRVLWREKEFVEIQVEVSVKQVIRGALAQYGLLKFVENP
jgi:hypothetical protein